MTTHANVEVVYGDLLSQQVEVIVNAWNRNLIPWWLLIPQGVSGAIRRKAGAAPFRELRKAGVLPSGGAAITCAGKLPYKAIIHVAGLNHFWMTSQKIIRTCVRSAIDIGKAEAFASIAFPLIGAGTGGISETVSLNLIQDEISQSCYECRVLIVRFKKK